MSGTVVTTPAIVLRTMGYGESDRIVTLLGRQTGKVSALARGARKSQRRFPGLGVGARGEARVLERSGDLFVLESFEISHGPQAGAADLARMAHVSYALELCERLCAARSRETAVHDWLAELLGLLERAPVRAERLRVFELGLLERLGIGPVLDQCTSCGRDDLGDEAVRFAPEAGGVVCRDCGGRGTPVGAAMRKALLTLRGLGLSESDAHTLAPGLNARCRDALLEYITLHTGGPLKTVEFIAKLGAT